VKDCELSTLCFKILQKNKELDTFSTSLLSCDVIASNLPVKAYIKTRKKERKNSHNSVLKITLDESFIKDQRLIRANNICIQKCLGVI